MRIFLSHASEQTEIAESIAIALRGRAARRVPGSVEALPSGVENNDRIREGALRQRSAGSFGSAPESVDQRPLHLSPSSSSRSSGGASPSDHVLPGRRFGQRISPPIPAYLKAVTLLEPQRQCPGRCRRGPSRAGLSGGIRRGGGANRPAVDCGAGRGLLHRAGFLTRRIANSAGSPAKCRSCSNRAGSTAVATLRGRVGLGREGRCPGASRRRRGQGAAQLAIDWLENIRVTVGQDTFTAIVGKVEPILVRCAGGVDVRRAADCVAHLGWGDLLRRVTAPVD